MYKPPFIIVRGIPGSGKSSVAALFHSLGYAHFETDAFFMVDGEYKFDFTKLHSNHMKCLEATKASLEAGSPTVVSNTFSTRKELKPYLELGKQLGIEPLVLTSHGDFGSIHGLPEEKMEHFRKKFVFDLSFL